IVKGKIPWRRLLRYARERAVRVDLRANRAKRARVRLARARLVETAQPGPNRAAERERKSGRRRRLEVRIVAIDHGVPQAGLVLQRHDLVELKRQRLAYLVNLCSKRLKQAGRLDFGYHLRRRDRKPAVAARPQTRRMRVAVNVGDVPEKSAAGVGQMIAMADHLIRRALEHRGVARDSAEQCDRGRGEVADVDPHFERRWMRDESAVGSSRG